MARYKVEVHYSSKHAAGRQYPTTFKVKHKNSVESSSKDVLIVDEGGNYHYIRRKSIRRLSIVIDID